VSLRTPDIAALGHVAPTPATAEPAPLEAHLAWDQGNGWQQHLTHLRLLLQPPVCSCLPLPLLHLVPLPHVQAVQTGLAALGSLIDTFRLALPAGQMRDECTVVSSALHSWASSVVLLVTRQPELPGHEHLPPNRASAQVVAPATTRQADRSARSNYARRKVCMYTENPEFEP
jgi:hypothetical protein